MSLLSLVIVTLNTRDLLRNLLLSIEEDRSLSKILKETIIVDNGSSDGTEEMVRREFTHSIFLKEEKNKGFAAAANRGSRIARGKYILFLNSDLIIVEGQISRMVEFMEKDESIGILGPKLIYPEGRYQRSYASFPSLLLEFIPKGLIKNRESSLPKEVDSIVGACMLVRKDIFDRIGGFDEGFFFFLEETDLCLRLKRKGYRVIYFPLSKVIHLQGQTVKKRWIKGRIEYHISLYRFLKKYHSTFYVFFFSTIRIFKSLIFLFFVSLFPLLLFNKKIRLSYLYYLNLIIWHFKGCPSDFGLRSK